MVQGKGELLVLDPLILKVGADDHAGRVAPETIRLLRKEFPVNSITGGASNVSFGMPMRPMLNANFLVVSVVMGMNGPITDVIYLELRYALLAADIFMGRDQRTRRFVGYFRSWKAKEGG